LGPAPAAAKMMALVGLLDFQTSCTVYDVEPTTGMTVCTNAALGEKVPAYPPLSFQATTVPPPYSMPVTMRPMSWLTPAIDVQRSALPEMIAMEGADG